jgi:hypothetical protein
MSVLTATPIWTRSRQPVATPPTSVRSRHDFGAITHVFAATAHHLFATASSDHPRVRRDHPARYAYLEDALMAREMGRL